LTGAMASNLLAQLAAISGESGRHMGVHEGTGRLVVPHRASAACENAVTGHEKQVIPRAPLQQVTDDRTQASRPGRGPLKSQE
jgi:hypothetical protein